MVFPVFVVSALEMKIIIIRNNQPLRIYHHPRNVVIHPKAKKVDSYDEDGTILESFDYVDSKLDWINDSEIDTKEISLTVNVK
jgi:hypothetical protein